MAAVAAAQPQEAMGHDPVLEEGVELVLDEARQFNPGDGLCAGDEVARMLLHQTVQRGLFGVVAFVVDLGATRRPPGLLRRGMHDGLPMGEPASSQAVLRASISLPADVCPPPRGFVLVTAGVRPAASGRRDQVSRCRLRVGASQSLRPRERQQSV